MMKKANKYFGQHVLFNSIVHTIGGIGIGVLIASPIANPHPVRLGVFLLFLSGLGHLLAIKSK